MKRSKRLGVVLDLAERKKAEAERFLSEQLQRVENDKIQLEQLESYLAQYQQEYQLALARGLAPDQIQNYQAFLGKLAATIGQHKKTMVVHEEQLAQVKQYWAQQYARHKGIDALIEKAKSEEEQAADKAFQKQLDELNQRAKPAFL